jgi:hypothetical protein
MVETIAFHIQFKSQIFQQAVFQSITWPRSWASGAAAVIQYYFLYNFSFDQIVFGIVIFCRMQP